MMPRPPLLALLLTAISACTAAPVDSPASERDLIIRSGTSFGMCVGHCTTELRIDAAEVVFVETSREPDRHPTRTRRARLTSAEWESLAARVDPEQLAALPATLGCPDCADGGAEWVEVELAGERRRVTFEHGSTVPRIAPLVERVREIRARFR